MVALMGDIRKNHVHTDTPAAVFSYAKRGGTDDSAALSDSVLDRPGIAPVPLPVRFGNSAFRDRLELKPERTSAGFKQGRNRSGTRIAAELTRLMVSLPTAVLGTHVGPGAWGILHQVEGELSDPFAPLSAGPEHQGGARAR